MKIFKTMILSLLISGTLLLTWSIIYGKVDQFELLSIKQHHSYVYTSDEEVYIIPLLINHRKSYHLLQEAMANVTIQSAVSDYTIPIDVVAIDYHGKVTVNHRVYERVDFVFKLAFYTEDYLINLTEALLVLNYLEEDALVVPIGEFNYLFQSMNPNHIRVHTRYNLHQTIDYIPTSVGIILEIENTTDAIVVIEKVCLNLSGILPDLSAIKSYHGDIVSGKTLEEALGFSYDIFQPPLSTPTSFTLPPMETLRVVIPFHYQSDASFLHRYPLIFRYTYREQTFTHVEDDFLYIKTEVFQPEGSHHVRIW